MRAPADLHSDGVGAINAGRLGRARQLLERARVSATEGDLLARIESSLAYVVAETGDRERALKLCDVALAREGISAPTRSSIHGQRGLLHMLGGRGEEALGDLTAAIDGDAAREVLGRAYLNRGGVHLQHGDVRAAASDFRAALDPLTGAEAVVEAAMAEHNLGYCLLLTGDLVSALARMDAARPVLAPLSPVSAATCDQDRAEILMAAGLLDQGRAALRTSAHAYGSRGLRRRQAEAELALARSLVDDDPVAAGRAARTAGRRFRAEDLAAWAVRADAVALSADVARGQHSSALLTRALATAVELDRQSLRWVSVGTQTDIARIELARGDVRGAQERVAALRASPGAPLAVRLAVRDVRAALAEATARRSIALQHLRTGLADLHAWQSSFGSLDLQTGVAGHGVRLGVRGLALAVESRKPAVLLEWSERARMLASRVQPVQAPEDEQLVADLAELRELASGEGRGDPVREAELRQRVRERAWQHRGSGEVADPVGLDELQTTLDPGTALVAYVVTPDVLVALVVTDAGATWVDLGARRALDDLVGGLLPDLDVAAADLAQPMSGAVRAALAVRLEELAALLVAPVLDAVGDRRVVLTPSGVLAGMPWTLLPGYVGRPVTVAQSATSWLARRTTPLRTRTAGFVAGPRVMRAEDEVNAAVKEWPAARVLTAASATAAAVSELAEQVDVLHVAAHGRHSAENPLFSGLMLADGSWFGYDIDRLRSVPDVVLLSACEVGRSTVRWGEELIGMSAAWLHAGARCVIASAAAINDAAAYDVLVAVHQRLAAGMDPAAALAEAVPAVTTGTAPVPLVCFG